MPKSEPKHDTTLIPHSETPEKQGFYDWLLAHGWRFQYKTVEWLTPASSTLQGRGRLSHLPDHSRAWISPPWNGEYVTDEIGLTWHKMPGPILVLTVVDGEVREA